MKQILIAALLIVASSTLALAQPHPTKPTLNLPLKSLEVTLRADGNFDTFLSLLKQAGLKNLGLVPSGG